MNSLIIISGIISYMFEIKCLDKDEIDFYEAFVFHVALVSIVTYTYTALNKL